MQRQRGFTLIELMVSSAVTFLTVLAVSAAFLGYTQSFYTQAGVRGGQASLRQTHLMVVRNLRMAGYGMEPYLAFDFPAGWSREVSTSPSSVNRSDRLVFRMRNPAFSVMASALTGTEITLKQPLIAPLRRGQILQVMCPGAINWTYARLSTNAAVGDMKLPLEAATGTFPNFNQVHTCFNNAGTLGIYVFKIDVYDYSIRLIDDDGNPSTPGRPYLFRRHGLEEGDPLDSYGEPVAEDIEAMRVTFVKGDGTPFIPNPTDPPDPTASPPRYAQPPPSGNPDDPSNIRAVVVGLVARSTTRDTGASPTQMNQIPAFGRKADGTAENPLLVDPYTNKPVAYGFRRIVSEMSIQVRNLRSSEMPVPIYHDVDATTACNGTLPEDGFNCAGG